MKVKKGKEWRGMIELISMYFAEGLRLCSTICDLMRPVLSNTTIALTKQHRVTAKPAILDTIAHVVCGCEKYEFKRAALTHDLARLYSRSLTMMLDCEAPCEVKTKPRSFSELRASKCQFKILISKYGLQVAS